MMLDRFSATFISQFFLATALAFLLFVLSYNALHFPDIGPQIVPDPGPQITVQDQVVLDRHGHDVSEFYRGATI